MKDQRPLADTLSWLREIGVDEWHGTEPLNRLKPVTAISIPDKKNMELSISPGATLDTVQSLGELKRALETFDGCALQKTAMNLVFADGAVDADIMMVGEAPGADEDRQGKPFVGMSGQLLDKACQSIGLDRAHNLYIANTIPWRPPGNRQPTPHEIQMMLPFIRKHIELKNPKILVLVGGVACKALLDKGEGITRLRGSWHDVQVGRLVIPTIPIYHPAYLLRSPSKKKEMWADMRAILKKLQDLNLMP